MMKRSLVVILALFAIVGAMTIVSLVSESAQAQLGKVYALLGKRAVVDDSLRVGGPFTLNGKAVVRDSVRVPRLIVSTKALAAGDSIAGMLRFDGTNVLFWSGSAWLQLNN